MSCKRTLGKRTLGHALTESLHPVIRDSPLMNVIQVETLDGDIFVVQDGAWHHVQGGERTCPNRRP